MTDQLKLRQRAFHHAIELRGASSSQGFEHPRIHPAIVPPTTDKLRTLVGSFRTTRAEDDRPLDARHHRTLSDDRRGDPRKGGELSATMVREAVGRGLPARLAASESADEVFDNRHRLRSATRSDLVVAQRQSGPGGA
ncbi:MAG TPA: hypothetical protein VKB25_01070 [Conexibacter sp.]|nr:hypothetical protein [Conexibacter sp.]